MATNHSWDPSIARAAQDVEAPESALREPEKDFHVGRGGAANVARLTGEEAKGAKGRNEKRKTSVIMGQESVDDIRGGLKEEGRKSEKQREAERERVAMQSRGNSYRSVSGTANASNGAAKGAGDKVEDAVEKGKETVKGLVGKK